MKRLNGRMRRRMQEFVESRRLQDVDNSLRRIAQSKATYTQFSKSMEDVTRDMARKHGFFAGFMYFDTEYDTENIAVENRALSMVPKSVAIGDTFGVCMVYVCARQGDEHNAFFKGAGPSVSTAIACMLDSGFAGVVDLKRAEEFMYDLAEEFVRRGWAHKCPVTE